MRIGIFALSCLAVVLLLTSPAVAGLTYADSWQAGSTSGGITYGSSGPLPAVAIGLGGASGSFDFLFGSPVHMRSLYIDYASVSGVITTMSVAFSEDGGSSFSAPVEFVTNVSVAHASQAFHYDLSGISVSLRDAVDEVRILFTMGGVGGGTLLIADVANPEPGTLALMGVGLLGIGATVVRRRKKRNCGPKA